MSIARKKSAGYGILALREVVNESTCDCATVEPVRSGLTSSWLPHCWVCEKTKPHSSGLPPT